MPSLNAGPSMCGAVGTEIAVMAQLKVWDREWWTACSMQCCAALVWAGAVGCEAMHGLLWQSQWVGMLTSDSLSTVEWTGMSKSCMFVRAG